MAASLIVTYHAIEPGPPPLCLEPDLLRAHLDCVVESGARVVTVHELVQALRGEGAPEPAVAITFDDGFASVAEVAAPLLVERGLRATVFCVAGHLGGCNDWGTQPARTPRLELASASQLAGLFADGFEIGSHGMKHAPLVASAPRRVVHREVVVSRQALEQATGVDVTSFAYPYGAVPDAAGRELVEGTYAAACIGALRTVGERADAYRLPRVDAHYVRRPQVLRGVLRGRLRPYLGVRRAGARARRMVVGDYRREGG